MQVHEFEAAVYELEGIVLIIRAKAQDLVSNYSYKNKADQTWTISEWKKKRIDQCVAGNEYIILDGNLEHAHGGTKLANLRASYSKK
ncbi:hypothetical protein ABWI01_05400 [Oceanicaulis alexandrii]|uniref:hypothetical protein n=1 Tax=Oceanicaulis alexandrii TaxID=153233 RepID=UPI0035CF7713